MTAHGRLDRVRESPVRFTAEEFMALATRPPLADVPGKLELVDGRIVRMSPANIPHWQFQQTVTAELRAIFQAAGSSWLVGSEATVRLSERKVRIPDIAALRPPGRGAKIFPAASLFLAVEISDTTLRIDLGPKRRDYALAGVPHYWVIDVIGRETHVMAGPTGAEYPPVDPVPFGRPITVPGADATIVIG